MLAGRASQHDAAKYAGRVAAVDWSAAFRAEVAHALGSGQPNQIERIYRDALRKRYANAAQLQLGILIVCAQLGSKRAARPWMERLAQRPEALRPDELAHAITMAVEMWQAESTLLLCRWLAATDPGASALHRLDASHRVMALAKRMRLPHGRNGAWTMHLRLLAVVCEMLEPALPRLPDACRCQACRLLDGVRLLQPASSRH